MLKKQSVMTAALLLLAGGASARAMNLRRATCILLRMIWIPMRIT